MLKKLLIGAAILAGSVGLVQAAGTIPGISMTQQLDSSGKPLNGGKLFLIQAGTTATPQNCYQDSNLTIAHPNPITLNSAGRIPQIFCADGQIKIRLTNAALLDQLVADNLLIVGPSGGGGGGGGVDPTTVLSTGDYKDTHSTGVLAGYVRCNGRTIGAASSGATERANADTSALFAFLYAADVNLTVSGGRGANASADYAANKTLTLPDCRSRVRAGLSDMGNSDSGRVTTTYFGCTGLVLGCAGGSETTTLTLAQLPTGITSSGTASGIGAPGSAIPTTTSAFDLSFSPSGSGTHVPATSGGWSFNNNTLSGTAAVTSNNTSGNAHRTVQPTILVTTYIKL